MLSSDLVIQLRLWLLLCQSVSERNQMIIDPCRILSPVLDTKQSIFVIRILRSLFDVILELYLILRTEPAFHHHAAIFYYSGNSRWEAGFFLLEWGTRATCFLD